MTFEFFNPTDLAFGQRLTAAFTNLENLTDAAEVNVKQVLDNMAYYSEYFNKNYRVSRPSSPGDPCRVDELFDIINDKKVYIKTFEYDSETLNVDVVIFNRVNNRITHATGSTQLRSGYCYYKESTTNKAVNTKLTFTSEEAFGEGALLCQFRIDTSDRINLVGDVSILELLPHGVGGYTSLGLSEPIAGDNTEYTSEDYECLCIIGKSRNLRVLKNGELIAGSVHEAGYWSQQLGERHCIVYVKPNDTITGIYKEIRRVNYK